MYSIAVLKSIQSKIVDKEYYSAFAELICEWYELSLPNVYSIAFFLCQKLQIIKGSKSAAQKFDTRFVDLKFLEPNRLSVENYEHRYANLNYNLKPMLFEEDIGNFFVHLLAHVRPSGMIIDHYIRKRKALVDVRLDNEYSAFRRNKIPPTWPYDYVTRYLASDVSQNVKPSDSTSLTFIYCVKNRPTRLRVSVETLLTSLRNAEESGVRYQILIIEDSSEGNFKGFDHNSSRYNPIRHIRVNTGIGWTRSGLLNYGIKLVDTEWIAFVDVDFLFHDLYCQSLSAIIQKCKSTNTVIASNLFETEPHLKDGLAYSAGSPYSYMWIFGSENTKTAGGFDEGYTGHGFEDRDIELKHIRIFGSRVIDTLTFDRDCYVLHLSHEVRTGSENRQINKERYLKRTQVPTAELIGDLSACGVYKSEFDFDYGRFKRSYLYSEHSKQEVTQLDFLFVPHNRYHSKTMIELCEKLVQMGFSARICNISPPHPEEGARDTLADAGYLDIFQFLQETHYPRNLVVMNDWEPIIVRPMIEWANSAGITTIAMVEGVNDFLDVDTKKNRKAYTRCRHLIMNGEDDFRFFNDRANKYVGGIQRLDDLFQKKIKQSRSTNRCIEIRDKKRVLVNCNFSYDVLAEYALDWLRSIQRQCDALCLELHVSQHLADNTDLNGFNVSTKAFYEDLEACDIFVSRFSGTILEALVLGKPVIYFNPGFECIDKFKDPLGAFSYVRSEEELGQTLKMIAEGAIEYSPETFLNLHTGCKYQDESDLGFSVNTTVDLLLRIATACSSEKSQLEPVFNKKFASLRRSVISGFRASRYYGESVVPLLNDVSFLVKSFGRRESVLSLIESIRARFVSGTIYVLDDSESALQFSDMARDVVDVVPSEIDVGLAQGRNELVDACSSRFIVLLDDDFIFSDNTHIDIAIHLLNFYGFDIIGGSVYDVGRGVALKDQPRSFYGALNFNSDEGESRILSITSGLPSINDGPILAYDLCMNFFVAERDFLLKNRWTAAFKLGEHLDFFLNAKDISARIGYFPFIQVLHDRSSVFSDDEYRKYRARADGFHVSFKRQRRVREIRHDGRVING